MLVRFGSGRCSVAPPIVEMRMRLSMILVLLCTALVVPTYAQTQVGGHYAATAQHYPDETRQGLGGFFVYAPEGRFGADVSSTYFFDEPVSGSLWQVLAGARVALHQGRIGVFGRLRPGFVRYSEPFLAPEIVCIAIFPTPEAC